MANRTFFSSLLVERDEVFYLYRDEITALLRDGDVSGVGADGGGRDARAPRGSTGMVGEADGVAALLAERRARQAGWAAMRAPPTLGIPAAALDPRPPLKDEVTADAPGAGAQLRGQPASGGRCRGRARVVPMSTILPPVGPGDVLVAENAGPMWTPVFPILGAIVLDHGVLTQHAATTAREFAVPAVINTGRATRHIPNGAWVVVDGDAGTVEVEPVNGP